MVTETDRRVSQLEAEIRAIDNDINAMDLTRTEAVVEASNYVESVADSLAKFNLFPKVETIDQHQRRGEMYLLEFHSVPGPYVNKPDKYYLTENGRMYVNSDPGILHVENLLPVDRKQDELTQEEFDFKYLGLARRAISKGRDLLKQSANSAE